MVDGSAWGLPAGTSLAMVAAVLIPVGIVTVLLRQLPFSLMRFVRSSELVDNFGRMMRVGVMFILVAYAVWGQKDAPGDLLASLLAAAFTLALHAWRRSSGLSIFAGTAFYMVLVNLVF